LELVSRMSAQGVKPNMKTLTAVMGACLSANRPDLAAKVFQKILRNVASSPSSSSSSALSPDGLAISKGIAALCGNGEIATALTILSEEPCRRRKNDPRFMTGKQTMMAYQTVIVSALSRQDFNLAKQGLSDLLERGYIPNKRLLRAMLEATGYRSDKKGHGNYFLVPSSSPSTSGLNGAEADDSAGHRVFRFLLFCLDALQGRSLPIEGSLYLATLTMGHQLGGCSRKLASLLVESKTKAAGNNGAGAQLLSSSSSSGTVQDKGGDDDEDCDTFPGWDGIFLNHYKSNGIDADNEDWYCRPPPVPVRVEPRELRRMLLAEQRVSSSSSSSLSKNRVRAESTTTMSTSTTTTAIRAATASTTANTS
jgi:hypothetical protein